MDKKVTTSDSKPWLDIFIAINGQDLERQKERTKKESKYHVFDNFVTLDGTVIVTFETEW
jgi:hypothetical protein